MKVLFRNPRREVDVHLVCQVGGVVGLLEDVEVVQRSPASLDLGPEGRQMRGISQLLQRGPDDPRLAPPGDDARTAGLAAAVVSSKLARARPIWALRAAMNSVGSWGWPRAS